MYTTILKEFDISDKHIDEITILLKDYKESDDIFYNILGQLKEGISVKKVIKDLDKDKINWDSKMYKELKEKRKIKDNNIENPPEFKEGEIECPKCKQKKTVVFYGQTRSCDEGYTYEMRCFNSKCKYIKRN